MSISSLSQVIASPLARATTVYGVANFTAAGLPFLALPVLTRFLTTEDYGIIAMFLVLNAVTAAITGLSVHGAIWRRFHTLSPAALADYIGACLQILAVSTAIVAGVFWFWAGKISAISGLPTGWLWAPVSVAACQFVSAIALSLWQLRGEPRAYAIFQVLQALTNVSVAILLVAGFGAGWRGSVIAQVFATCSFAGAALLIVLRRHGIGLRFNADYTKDAMAFGVPLIPHAIGSLAITMTDRVLITNLVGLAETGVYALGAQVAMILGLAIEAFTRAYFPWLYGALREAKEDLKRTIVRVTYACFLVFILGALCMAWVAPWFLEFYVGKEFRSAGQYVLWLSLAQAFVGMYYVTGIYIAYTGKTLRSSWVTISLAILNYFLCRHFIEWNGALGAAQSFALINLLMFLIFWRISSAVYHMPWLRRH